MHSRFRWFGACRWWRNGWGRRNLRAFAPTVRVSWSRCSRDPELVCRARRARLSLRALRDRACGRYVGSSSDDRQGAHHDLCADARRLLHLLDLLRLRRFRQSRGARFPRHLCRADPCDRAGPSLRRAHRLDREVAEHHLGGRFRRRALRQERAGGSAGLHRRRDRRAALHRLAAEGGGELALRLHRRIRHDRADGSAGAGRPRLLGRDRACRLRLRLRHTPYRRHRASGRARPGDRGRVARQARRLSRSRHLRALRAVRRRGRSVREGRAPRRRPAADLGTHVQLAQLPDADTAVGLCSAAACPAVPYDDRREPRPGRCAPRGLDVPTLPRADQSLRAAGGHGGRAADAGAGDRPRHDGGDIAAPERSPASGAVRLRRRAIGCDGDGHRRLGRAGDHDLEPPRHAAPAAPARRGWRIRARKRRRANVKAKARPAAISARAS